MVLSLKTEVTIKFKIQNLNKLIVKIKTVVDIIIYYLIVILPALLVLLGSQI